ncbi:MAG: hypothetical protein NZL87_04280 [Thermomicrobium sp.]|nr:hypothetical protein [Thermomicrobium sp.]
MPSFLAIAHKLAREEQKAGDRVASKLPTNEADLWKLMGFSPRDIQRASLTHTKRFSVEVWHRRAGKTVMKIVKLITRAVFSTQQAARFAFLAPTYSQAEDIAWAYLLRFTEWAEPYGRQVHHAKLSVTLPNVGGHRSRIRLYGVDSPKQRLRGLYLDGVVLDEFQDIPMVVWAEQVRPMLTDISRRGTDSLGYPNQWADFIGTPRGRNQLYHMWVRASRWSRGETATEWDPEKERYVQVRSADWFAAMHKASETKLIPAEELAHARRDMGESRYLQEFECSFDAIVSGAVFGPGIQRIRKAGRIGTHPVNPGRPVNTAWDLGWDDATAIWFFQHSGNDIVLVDYLEVSQKSLADIVERLAEKNYRYGYHLLPWDVGVTELGSGKSRRSILMELGVRATVVPKVQTKADAHAAGQALLDRCWFDEEACADGLDKLALYRREYDERLGRFREEAIHDFSSHAADAFMTLALGLKRMVHDEDAPPPVSAVL